MIISATPLLSLVICTYNRAHLLDDTLHSFAKIPALSDLVFEVLVIDNNSNDDTHIIVERWAKRANFKLRYIFESKQGVSNARNCAITEAHGLWIWFVDDDVYFDENWLRGVAEGLRSFPDAAAIAGRVMLEFEQSQPDWLTDSALNFYGLTRFGEQTRWLDFGEYPITANAGFRRDVFKNTGLFRIDLGRVGSSLRSWDETELSMRIYHSGRQIAYVPDAMVRHRISPSRSTRVWLVRRVFWDGISQVIAERNYLVLSRKQLLNQAWEKIQYIIRALLSKRILFIHQLDYVRVFGMAIQYLIEAIRPRSEQTLL